MSEETTQNLSPTFSSLLAIWSQPQIITGWLRDILTHHFQERQIEESKLSRLIWRNTERTAILIENHTTWTPSTTGKRPAVVVKRNACENVQIAIANRHTGLATDGRDRYSAMWSGSHTLFAIGETGAQAEVLAEEIKREMQRFAEVIRESLLLHRFRVISVGEAHELEESAENFVVPVTVGYMYEENWAAGPDAPRLNKISISLSSFLDG